MDDPREEQIRQELLQSPPPTYTEISQKYHIAYPTIARLRRQMGVPRNARISQITLRDRVRTVVASNPEVSNYEIANNLGISHYRVRKYRQSGPVAIQEQAPGTVRKQAAPRPDRKTPGPPSDPVREVQWMWRQAKELRIQLRYALRRMGEMTSRLNDIYEIIDRLRPYELWVRYYTKGTPGYGSLPLFLAERSGLDLETLRTRFWEAGDRYNHLLSIIDEIQTEGEVYTNGTGTDIRN